MTTLITPTAERSRRTVRLRSWQTAAGLAAIAAGAAIVTGALLPWVETFAGLIGIPGIRGTNGRLLAAAGVLIAAAGIYHLVRGGQAARWLTGIAGFAALGFSAYLLIQLTRSMSVLGGDSMVVARGGPGLWVAAGGSATAFATLFLPPSSQRTLRRPEATGATLAWAADRDAAGLRRGLQVALGLVWLLDAALQYQPYMFSRNFVTSVLEPASMGSPALLAGPAAAAARIIAHDVVAWNAAFATIQLALAAGLLWRRTARAALYATIGWALAVWLLAEGAGGVLSGMTGMANPLTGAPGAAVLYALLALLILPSRVAPRTVAGAGAGAGRKPAGPALGAGGLGSAVGRARVLHAAAWGMVGGRHAGHVQRPGRWGAALAGQPEQRDRHRLQPAREPGLIRPGGRVRAGRSRDRVGGHRPARAGPGRPARTVRLGRGRGLRRHSHRARYRPEQRPAAHPARRRLLAAAPGDGADQMPADAAVSVGAAGR